ncbi:hypothetical protein B0H19DRAFT_1262126 [Mycena capillaripes]|nr:hypothetical protein B0H19DRAFT_1262126 [Mycena capillaripes]
MVPAGTCIGLVDCAPGAFNSKVYYDRVALNERRELTVHSLFENIDWDHIISTSKLHFVRELAEFVPQLHILLPLIMVTFRSAPIAKHRMREDRGGTPLQPVGTNGERSTENQGMERAVHDIDTQVGIDSSIDSGPLSWLRDDGASYAAMLRLTKLCAPLGDKFKRKISTPEIWHTGATDLNSISENHYGPATFSDPSSLSKCSNAAGLKRPSNIKSCDYYPTMRNLRLIYTAHVLDCWRVYFSVENLLEHFQDLETAGNLPTLETLLEAAEVLVDRYTSQAAVEHALDATEATSDDNSNRVPVGSPWVTRTRPGPTQEPREAASDPMPDLVEIQEPDPSVNSSEPTQQNEEAPKQHEERSGFTGDRVLRNSQIFMMEFGWWLELIMAIWIFKFAGSSHQNYMAYLLEVYCFLRYEASKDLKNAILNNWLINVRGELGKWLPANLHQEHYNRWLEDMIQKHGGEFDDKFYRETISPNVHHFLRIKEEITAAFDSKRRGKTHTSPHLRAELHLLLTMFKEQEAHLFRSGCSLGHAAINQFARGCRRLEEGKLQEWLDKSTSLGDFLQVLHRTEGKRIKYALKLARSKC